MGLYGNSSDAYLEWSYRMISCICWVPLAIIGICGNLMVILVVMTVRGMKTPTNCYLVSLAVADCLFFVSSTPVELSSIHLPEDVFLFGRIGCSILRFLPFLSMNASSLSITAFTVERYIGICHPMKARYICTVKRAQLIIVVIWSCSILYNSTWLFLTDLKPLNYTDWPNAYQCTYSLNRASYKAVFLLDLFAFYWIPLLLYVILYGSMARIIVKARFFHSKPNMANVDIGEEEERGVVNGSRVNQWGTLRKTRSDQRNTNHSVCRYTVSCRPEGNGVNATRNNETRTRSFRESKAYYGQSLNKARVQVVKMLIVIVLVFALFWLPYRGLVVYNSFTSKPWIDKWYLLSAKTMVMANSAMNPILYNLMSGKFRTAFILMFKRCFNRGSFPQSYRFNSEIPSTPLPNSVQCGMKGRWTASAAPQQQLEMTMAQNMKHYPTLPPFISERDDPTEEEAEEALRDIARYSSRELLSNS